PPPSTVPVIEADDLPAEADREGLDRNAVPSRHEVVPHLVDENDDRQHDNEGRDCVEDRQAEEGQLRSSWYAGVPIRRLRSQLDESPASPRYQTGRVTSAEFRRAHCPTRHAG